jgi:FkbM family methyltransferase
MSHSSVRRLAGRVLDRFVYPLTPRRHALALRFTRWAHVHGWEPEVLRIRDYARPGVALDVGANMGLWSYAMARSGLFSEVIAFEPNTALTADLRNARLPGLRLIDKAVSSTPGTATLRIPRKGHMQLDGWASLEARTDLEADAFLTLDIETIRLDDLGLSSVGFVKIDVEGHELSALEGARRLFTDSRPVCILEYRERNRDAVLDFFRGLGVGYAEVDTRSRYGFPLTPGNMLVAAA